MDKKSSCLFTLKTTQQANIHELLHTIPCLGDEYGAFGNSYLNSVLFSNELKGTSLYQFWKGNSYQECLNNAPWKDQIGNGCGEPGVIDCFKEGCLHPIKFTDGVDFNLNCCSLGTDCFSEIGCFEGGLYSDTGIWRASSGSILRLYFADFNNKNIINLQDQRIVQKVINKGPAIGKKWELLPIEDIQIDCDITLSQFSS